MKPVFEISGDPALKEAAATYGHSLSFTDAEGDRADRLIIKLVGSQAYIPRSVKFTAHIGYLETGLRDIGIFEVQRFDIATPPMMITIESRPHSFSASMKTARTRSWGRTSLGQIVSTIASEHGYQATIAPSLGAITIAHESQTQESNAAFIGRLAKSFGANVKLSNGHLALSARGAGQSGTGREHVTHHINPSDITSLEISQEARSRYGSAVAYWQDHQKGLRLKTKAGTGEPVLELQQPYSDEAQAQAAAGGALRKSQAAAGNLRIIMPGRPEIAAGNKLALTGFPGWLQPEWVAKTITHKLGRDGYIMNIDADFPVGDKP